MKRKDFLKMIGIGAAAAVVAPKAIAKALEPEEKVKKGWELLNDPNLLSESDKSAIDLIKTYDQTGNLYYRENPKTIDESFEWFEEKRLHAIGTMKKECTIENRTTREWLKKYFDPNDFVGPPEMHKEGIIFSTEKIKWIRYTGPRQFNGWFWYV